jgi:hypothetical protein
LSKSKAPPIEFGNIQPVAFSGLMRLEDRNDAGVFIILVGFSLIFEVSPPHRAPDIEN